MPLLRKLMARPPNIKVPFQGCWIVCAHGTPAMLFTTSTSLHPPTDLAAARAPLPRTTTPTCPSTFDAAPSAEPRHTHTLSQMVRGNQQPKPKPK